MSPNYTTWQNAIGRTALRDVCVRREGIPVSQYLLHHCPCEERSLVIRLLLSSKCELMSEKLSGVGDGAHTSTNAPCWLPELLVIWESPVVSKPLYAYKLGIRTISEADTNLQEGESVSIRALRSEIYAHLLVKLKATVWGENHY